jgi:signal peptidase I
MEHEPRKATTLDTIGLLLISFALAMTFRGFVIEGYVIPTGSMAPTLMGEHLRLRSPDTGYSYPADAAPVIESARAGRDFQRPIGDPMISHSAATRSEGNIRLAQQPARWDVVVFKNPCDPVGDATYYIKRLVGMPGERFCIADGDVFTGDREMPVTGMRVQRKPEHVQRAVLQPLWNSDYAPIDPAAMRQRMRGSWSGPPMRGQGWDTGDPRTFVWNATGPARLEWDPTDIPLDDWNAYNSTRPEIPLFPVGDLRVAAHCTPASSGLFSTTLSIGTRAHRMVFTVASGKAALSVVHAESGEVKATAERALTLPDGPFELECWHIDQRLQLFIDGESVLALDYEWDPQQRLQASHNGRTIEQVLQNPTAQKPTPTTLSWEFGGGPVTLRRIRVDRDLYYRPAFLNTGDQYPMNGPPIPGLAFGVDVNAPPQIGDGEFVMFGDNSGASRDSRLWGRPHPLVSVQLGNDSPFVVPEDLMIGKAWCVYFPAPMRLSPGSTPFIPDFGELRFIR